MALYSSSSVGIFLCWNEWPHAVCWVSRIPLVAEQVYVLDLSSLAEFLPDLFVTRLRVYMPRRLSLPASLCLRWDVVTLDRIRKSFQVGAGMRLQFLLKCLLSMCVSLL